MAVANGDASTSRRLTRPSYVCHLIVHTTIDTAPTPNHSLLHETIETVRDILNGMSGSIAATGLLRLLEGVM